MVGLMRIAGLALAVLIIHPGAWASASETDFVRSPPPTAEQPAEGGFVDVAVGFQRLPPADARYVDGDSDVAGGADPRWRPSRPSHMAMAERLAKGPSSGMRDATRYPYLLSLQGDRAGAEAGMLAAKQRYPDSVGVHWSEGWIRLNLRDYEGALAAWSVAERLHGGQPFWVPYTKAIALAGLGDDEAALAWWRVAQRSHAPELDSAAGARQRPGWGARGRTVRRPWACQPTRPHYITDPTGPVPAPGAPPAAPIPQEAGRDLRHPHL